MKMFTPQAKKTARNNGAGVLPAAAYLLALFILMTGCANFPVVVNDDPFKGVKIVSVDMWHTVLDSNLDNIRALYKKKVSNGTVSDPMVTIVFVAVVDPYGGYSGQKLSREGYIMADSQSFPVDLIESEKERVKDNSVYYDPPFYSSFYFGYPFGYPHMYFYSPGVVIVKERRKAILTARLRLTPAIQSAIIGAHSYKIRLYLGETPVTLEATARQLEALKQFIAYGQPGAAPADKGSGKN